MNCTQCPYYVPQEKYCAHLATQINPEKPQCKTPPPPQILIWSYRTGEVKAVAWSPDGSMLAAGNWNNKVYVFSGGGELLWSRKVGGSVYAVAWSPDGSMLAAGSSDGKVYVFSGGGELLWSREIGGRVYAVAWSPDGSMLAAGSYNRKVYVFVFSLALIRAVLRRRLYGVKLLLGLV